MAEENWNKYHKKYLGSEDEGYDPRLSLKPSRRKSPKQEKKIELDNLYKEYMTKSVSSQKSAKSASLKNHPKSWNTTQKSIEFKTLKPNVVDMELERLSFKNKIGLRSLGDDTELKWKRVKRRRSSMDFRTIPYKSSSIGAKPYTRKCKSLKPILKNGIGSNKRYSPYNLKYSTKTQNSGSIRKSQKVKLKEPRSEQVIKKTQKWDNVMIGVDQRHQVNVFKEDIEIPLLTAESRKEMNNHQKKRKSEVLVSSQMSTIREAIDLELTNILSMESTKDEIIEALVVKVREKVEALQSIKSEYNHIFQSFEELFKENKTLLSDNGRLKRELRKMERRSASPGSPKFRTQNSDNSFVLQNTQNPSCKSRSKNRVPFSRKKSFNRSEKSNGDEYKLKQKRLSKDFSLKDRLSSYLNQPNSGPYSTKDNKQYWSRGKYDQKRYSPSPDSKTENVKKYSFTSKYSPSPLKTTMYSHSRTQSIINTTQDMKLILEENKKSKKF